MKLHYPPPEEQIDQIERQQEMLNAVYERLFGNSKLIHMWVARNVYSSPIRKMAITFHMSRYSVRKHLKECEKKIEQIRNTFKVGNTFLL